MSQLIKGFLFFLIIHSASAQVTTKSHNMDREITLQYDNDAVFITDQYYTSGADISFAKLLTQNGRFYNLFSSKKTDSSKLIFRINFGHKVFNPLKIRERELVKRDRPYAGWQYLSFSANNFPNNNSTNKYKIELGVVGKRSGMGDFQKWWHSESKIVAPRGWEYEIANEFIINLNYERIQRVEVIKHIDFISNTNLQLGNGNSFGAQSLSFRLGKANGLNNSSSTESRMSNTIPVLGNDDKEETEAFFFYGIECAYVLNNIFIEGSIFHNNSIHTETAETLLLTRKWGFTYSNYYTTFSVIIYQLGREVVGGKRHNYAGVQLGLRF